MIVSIAIVDFPVARSPMISSRWPRPIGIIASIAMMPVCTGWLTLFRLMTPGAIFSSGYATSDLIGPLPSSGWPERVHHATEQPFADRHLQKFAGRLGFVAFHDLRRVAEEDRADFGFFEVEREPKDAAREFDHFVQHDVAQTFDARDAVTGFADNADVALARRGFEAGDLRFDFFEDTAHS